MAGLRLAHDALLRLRLIAWGSSLHVETIFKRQAKCQERAVQRTLKQSNHSCLAGECPHGNPGGVNLIFYPLFHCFCRSRVHVPSCTLPRPPATKTTKSSVTRGRRAHGGEPGRIRGLVGCGGTRDEGVQHPYEGRRGGGGWIRVGRVKKNFWVSVGVLWVFELLDWYTRVDKSRDKQASRPKWLV